MADLVLYNSLTRATEAFAPIDPGNVRVYSCGPTVYHDAHIGNLRAYVFTDTLARTIRWKGFPLTHVLNITDVGHLQSDADAGEDKLEARARETGQDIWAIARRYEDAFRRDLKALNIAEPTVMPRATDHVDGMRDFAEAIEANGFAYPIAGGAAAGLYFDVGRLGDAYGRLARTGGDGPAEARIDDVAGKRHPADFALWRTSGAGENRQMEWDSRWGRGAPGWHLECSVMARRYLGDEFDIHTGGIDHREIHHPNEIAQNQAFHGRVEPGFTGARVWMHNNFLVQRAGKMSKSSGEFLTLPALVARGFHPLAYRMLCLQAHYGSELDFSWEGLAAAFVRLKRLVQAVEALRARGGEVSGDAGAHRAALDEAMSDDLATPRALTALDAMLADKRLSPAGRLATLDDFDAVLGLGLATLTRDDLRTRPDRATVDTAAIEDRLDARRAARAAKDFARSDAIRGELAAAGVEVMDGDPLGWDWKPDA